MLLYMFLNVCIYSIYKLLTYSFSNFFLFVALDKSVC